MLEDFIYQAENFVLIQCVTATEGFDILKRSMMHALLSKEDSPFRDVKDELEQREKGKTDRKDV